MSMIYVSPAKTRRSLKKTGQSDGHCLDLQMELSNRNTHRARRYAIHCCRCFCVSLHHLKTVVSKLWVEGQIWQSGQFLTRNRFFSFLTVLSTIMTSIYIAMICPEPVEENMRHNPSDGLCSLDVLTSVVLYMYIRPSVQNVCQPLS